MKKIFQYRFLCCAALILTCLFDVAIAQQPVQRNVPGRTDGGSSRSRDLLEQMRRGRSAQQRPGAATQGGRQGGLITMNLTGLETFGDALGTAQPGFNEISRFETFTINTPLFSNPTLSGGMFRAQVASLTGGPGIGISAPADGSGTVRFTSAPASVTNGTLSYLGQTAIGTNRDFPAGSLICSDQLIAYAKEYGIDVSQLVFDDQHSQATFVSDGAGGITLTDAKLVYGYTAITQVPIQSPGGAVYGLGRQKITENMTPIPTDRFFFDYSYFHNVPLAYRTMPVNRFTPGFEKTFLDKRFSFEMRLPFAATIDHNLYDDNDNRLSVFRLGDMTMMLKWLLFQREKFYLTVGLGLSVPLSEDMRLYDSVAGHELIRWQNETCHVMPYVGFLYLPHPRTFLQMYFQIDASTHGDPTYVRDAAADDAMLRIGKTFERTYAYTSLALGYWLFRNESPSGRVRNGMNLIGELHWTQSVDRGKGVRYEQGTDLFDIGNVTGSYSVLNMTLGTRMLFNEKTNLGIGYALPLSGDRRQFDGELRMTVNRYF